MPPSREEQIAQIQAALRSRFFPLVPSLGVSGWTQDQDDTNRLSRALAAYALVGICDLDDASAAACITDGGDDGGIDAAHYDRANSQLVLVQAKFKRNGAAPTQAECLATVNGVKALREKRFDQFNTHFPKKRSTHLASASRLSSSTSGTVLVRTPRQISITTRLKRTA